MDLREQDYVNASNFATLRDLVARRSIELGRPEHQPLEPREIWWALEATLRLLAEYDKPHLTL